MRKNRPFLFSWLMWQYFLIRQKSNLIHFGDIWSNLIKNEMTIFILMMNVTFFDMGGFQFHQVWSILDSSDPIWSKKIMIIFTIMVNVTTFYSNIFWLVRTPIWSSLIHFDPFWSILDRSDPIWSKKFIIKGK